MTESSAEFEIFGTGPSGTIQASCFDEDPNGISILTKSDSKTCCKEENIILDVNEEKSCEDMDNRRSVFSLGLLSSWRQAIVRRYDEKGILVNNFPNCRFFVSAKRLKGEIITLLLKKKANGKKFQKVFLLYRRSITCH